MKCGYILMSIMYNKLGKITLMTYVEDGCCPFKIVFDEDFYVHFMCILLCFKCVLGSA